MQLDVNVDAEPLTDWFSSNFPKKHSILRGQPADGPVPSSSEKYSPGEALVEVDSLGKEVYGVDESTEEMLANLQAMDVRLFSGLPVSLLWF
jgi:hypothetical protein